MELREAIEQRRSVRAFKPEPVSEETITDLLRAASHAPSSHNLQPWRFHVVMGEARADVAGILSQTTRFVEEYLATLDPEDAEVAEHFFAELGGAPVIVAVSAPVVDDEMNRITTCISIGGAIQNLQLAAYARGLGTCAVTWSYWLRGQLAERMGVPDDREIVSLVLLGVPAESPPMQPRRDDVVTFVE